LIFIEKKQFEKGIERKINLELEVKGQEEKIRNLEGRLIE
jgi:hypothetical protein